MADFTQSPTYIEALAHLLDLEFDPSVAHSALQTVFEANLGVDELVEASLVVLSADSDESEDVSEPAEPMKVVVVVRADLAMSIGKTAAQVGHGIHVLCREASSQRLDAWESSDSPIIVVQVPDKAGLDALIDRCKAAQMSCFPIEDAGRTEVDPGTMTVVSVGPGTRAELEGLTGSLRLLK